MTTIIGSAPGRCGIVGNPSDMYGGNVLSCSVQERAECRLTESAGRVRLVNGNESAIVEDRESLRLRGDILDIARAALLHFGIDPRDRGFELRLSTDIPMRAGLAGSTAMLAAIVGVLDAYTEGRRSPYALAETTRKIEARIMNVTCGFQDQHMAVFGGLNFMSFAGKEDLEQREDEPFATVEPLGYLAPNPPLLLAHTGVQHNSGAVHRTPRERWVAGEEAFRRAYARIADLARMAKRRLIEADWAALGGLMNENHSLIAELGGSGPENEQLIEAARGAGAWGAKLAGAGGGGTIVALTDRPDLVSAALMAAGATSLYTPRPQPGLTVDSI